MGPELGEDCRERWYMPPVFPTSRPGLEDRIKWQQVPWMEQRWALTQWGQEPRCLHYHLLVMGPLGWAVSDTPGWRSNTWKGKQASQWVVGWDQSLSLSRWWRCRDLPQAADSWGLSPVLCSKGKVWPLDIMQFQLREKPPVGEATWDDRQGHSHEDWEGRLKWGHADRSNNGNSSSSRDPLVRATCLSWAEGSHAEVKGLNIPSSNLDSGSESSIFNQTLVHCVTSGNPLHRSDPRFPQHSQGWEWKRICS